MRSEVLESANKYGWTLIREDKKTKALFYEQPAWKMIFWYGKNSIAITGKGAKQRYMRKIWVDQIDPLFKNPARYYKASYDDRTEENRSIFRSLSN